MPKHPAFPTWNPPAPSAPSGSPPLITPTPVRTGDTPYDPPKPTQPNGNPPSRKG